METTGEITWLSSFSTTGLIESGPADLATFRFDRSLATPKIRHCWVLTAHALR